LAKPVSAKANGVSVYFPGLKAGVKMEADGILQKFLILSMRLSSWPGK